MAAPIVILGARGQLGGECLRVLGSQAVGLSREQLDLGDLTAIESRLRALQPRAVINCAAYNDVDGAERDTADALAVNAEAPRRLAQIAARSGWQLIHFSTDYVFGDDRLQRPRLETDAPAPMNAYGRSKLLGEQAVLTAAPGALVIRVAHLFGGHSLSPGRDNLVERFLQRMRSGQPILAVRGQFLNPTSVRDIVPATLRLLDGRAAGLFHLTGEGECTVSELAAELARLSGMQAQVTELERDTRPAPRARYTVLENRRWNQELALPPLPHWRDALTACLPAI